MVGLATQYFEGENETEHLRHNFEYAGGGVCYCK
jgi:hypothetical protein